MARLSGVDILRKWMGSTKACGKVVVCGAVKRTLMRPPLCACLKPLTQIGVRLTKNDRIMKELIDILMDDNKSFEGLPKWVWMVAFPAALVLACIIGGTLS